MSKSTAKKEIISGKYNRYFSEAFKREKIKEIEKGVLCIAVLCKLHSISRTTVYRWIYLYSSIEKGTKTVVQMESEQHKTLYLQQRLAELERIIGQKQMEIDYLNKALEISSEELGYDLKKKYEQQHLSGLEKISIPTK
ncbi:MAG: transposase [Bacteroidota bacterium]|nr:transposase [Bacteroidota bacterium]